MGRFYGLKIKNEEINRVTGEPWKMDDVPKLWKRVTEDWLNNESIGSDRKG